jgi:putative ABC transport system permease protein
MKVRNSKCVNRLAVRAFLSARRRNIIAVVAIMLTSVLFTAIFAVSLSLVTTFNHSIMKQSGIEAHGYYAALTDEELALLSSAIPEKYRGTELICGYNDSPAFRSRLLRVGYVDKNAAKWEYITLSEGHLPTSPDEIAMDTEALKALGIEPKLGAKVELPINIGNDPSPYVITDTFTLSGLWEFDPVLPLHMAVVDETYAREAVEKAVENGYRRTMPDLYVMFSSSRDIIGQMEKWANKAGLKTTTGFEEDAVGIHVNPGYMPSSNAGDAEAYAAIAAFSLLIIFTGYLIIYNIFQISVTSDIRFYGLLKTIGVTSRQIKRIIRLQALILCTVGIPFGLIAGYLLGSALSGTVIKSITDLNYVQMSTSPVIFIGSALFEVLTVLISVSKPGRMAASVSPVEAAKYTEDIGKIRQHRTGKGSRVVRMAFANMARNRKKSVLVFISLALSVVLLNSVYMLVSGFDPETYISKTVSMDFVVGNNNYFRSRGAAAPLETGDLNEIISETRRSADGFGYGVTKIMYTHVDNETKELYNARHISVGISAPNGSPTLFATVEALDDTLLSHVKVLEGDISKLNDPKERYVACLAHVDENGNVLTDDCAPKVGEKVIIGYADGFDSINLKTGKSIAEDTDPNPDVAEIYTNTKEIEYTVCAYIDVPNQLTLRFQTVGLNVVAGVEGLKADLGDCAVPVFYAFDTPDEDASRSAEELLSRITGRDGSILSYESKALMRKEMADLKLMFAVIGGVLIGIIAAVGILNFINSVLAGIIGRKTEFAILEAIGMTRSQLRKMLMVEGMINTLGAGLFASVLAPLTALLLNVMGESLFWFYKPHFTILPVAFMLPTMALFGIIVPLLAFSGSARTGIVERIREVG